VVHITKDGMPRRSQGVEHMVDYRVYNLRAIGILPIVFCAQQKIVSALLLKLVFMKCWAMVLREVSNPSEILISQKDGQLSGATIGGNYRRQSTSSYRDSITGESCILWYAAAYTKRIWIRND